MLVCVTERVCGCVYLLDRKQEKREKHTFFFIFLTCVFSSIWSGIPLSLILDIMCVESVGKKEYNTAVCLYVNVCVGEREYVRVVCV